MCADGCVQTADAVLQELGLEPESYLAIHWRESEEGCQLERDEVHQPYDMCFGTSGTPRFTVTFPSELDLCLAGFS